MDPAESLRVASEGFDLLFANNLVGAVDLFGADGHQDSPFHLMGLGVCAFLKAALGMEVRGVPRLCITTRFTFALLARAHGRRYPVSRIITGWGKEVHQIGEIVQAFT